MKDQEHELHKLAKQWFVTVVRGYIRQTTRGQTYSTEDIVNAVRYVRAGHSSYEAEKIYGVPSKTIRRRLDPSWGDPSIRKHGGFQQLFTPEQEQELAKYLKMSCERFLGLSMRELRSFAYELAEMEHLPHRFNKTTKMAGYDWVHGFFDRNPSLSFRTPQATSIYRARGFSKENVNVFHRNFEKIQAEHNFPPERIYNVDETGFSVVMRTVKVVGEKGTRQVGRLVSAERGRLVTAICCGSAGGEFVPPVLVFPAKNPNKRIQEKMPQGWLLKGTGNGWSNTEIFMAWMEHFTAHTKPTAQNPVLLVLDNHKSHTAIQILNFCDIHNVHMVSIPPHTSHKLQPLDVSVYASIKSRLSKLEQEWMSANAPRRLTEDVLPEIFQSAYEVGATAASIISGFRKCGIVPFNPSVFSEKDYAPSQTFKNPIFVNNDIPENQLGDGEEPDEAEEDNQPTMPTEDSDMEIEMPHQQEDPDEFFLEHLVFDEADLNLDEGESNGNNPVLHIDLTDDNADNGAVACDGLESASHNQSTGKRSFESELKELAKQHGFDDAGEAVPLLENILESLKKRQKMGEGESSTGEAATSSFKQSPFKVRPLPTISAVQNGRPRGRKPGKSEILTSSQFKQQLLDCEEKRNVKRRSYDLRTRHSVDGQ